MNSDRLRNKFLEFFEKRGHKIVPSSSLIPTDPSVLFTTAGMQQFKPYYLGEKSPYGDDVISCQKCIRTSDIDEVGDESHLTFFEMLGNFSFASYFKKEAIELAHEFIKDELGLGIDYVTVFKGGENIPKDTESAKIWNKLGFSEEKGNLKFCDKKENFWGPTGDEGPCGPTTEIYVNGIEIWNIVFNQYYYKDGKLTELETPGIDTGMGLERLAMVIQKKETVFETDLFSSIFEKIDELRDKKFDKNIKAFKIIADHVKAAVMILGDENGIIPSNKREGYVLRKLIRRAAMYSSLIGMKYGAEKSECVLDPIANVVIDVYKNINNFSNLDKNRNKIKAEIYKEEARFKLVMKKGSEEIRKVGYWLDLEFKSIGPHFIDVHDGDTKKEIQEYKISAESKRIAKELGIKLFDVYQEGGYPLELSLEKMAAENLNIRLINKEETKRSFEGCFLKHQDLSRTASVGMFKGGLADASGETTKLHTAAHLMLAGLRKALGDHVVQKGSKITAERLRFDFSHPAKITKEEIKEVEDFVNDAIKKELFVKCEEMTLEEAKKINAIGVFESKYGEKVKVYTIGKDKYIVSREICGGPHVEKLEVLGHFKIIKEESSSAGIRRIKAILE